MVIGAAASAVGAYLFQVIGGRALGPERFAPVSVMWTLLFIGFTVFILPIEQMVIRRVVQEPTDRRLLVGSGQVVVAVVGFATSAAIGVVVFAGDSLLGGDRGYVLVAAAMFLPTAVLAIGRGHLAGRHRFTAYGLVVGLEAIVKVLGAAVVAIAGWGPIVLSWVLILSPWIVLVVRPFRGAGSSDAGTAWSPDESARFLGGFLVANAASQTVLAAGPVVVGALGASSGAVSVFFVTTTLFRGPMSSLYNLVARALPAATRQAAAGDRATLDRWVRRFLITGLGLGLAGGALTAVVGPRVVGALYGAEFTPGAWLAALAAAGVIVGIGGLATAQILVARGETMSMAVVWLIALGLSVITVALSSGDPSIRVAAAFCVGEVSALVGLGVAALHRSPR